MIRRWVLFLVLATTAAAQDARALFEEGAALYEKGAYLAAALKFEASFAARPLPLTKFNVARCYEQAGKTVEAIDAWQAWLAMSPAARDRPEGEVALTALGRKLSRLGVQALTVSSLPTGARVFVDGVLRGPAPLTVELPAGRHLIRLEQEGRAPQERVIAFSVERPVAERFELEPLAAPQAPPAAPLVVLPDERPRVPRPAAEPTDAPALDGVRVVIDTSHRGVRLFRANGSPNGECRTPCDQLVSRASDNFFIAGDNVTASAPFVLADHRVRGAVRLKVKPGNATAFLLGIVLGGTAAVGGFSIGIPFSLSSTESFRVGGYAGLAVGAAGALTALVLGLTNTTAVTFEP